MGTRALLLAGLAASLAGCIAPIRPSDAFERDDLDLCWTWRMSQGKPGGIDQTATYFVLSDGSPSFRSVRWIDTGQTQGCDVVAPLGFRMPGFTAIWDVPLYSARTQQRLGNAHAEGNNFSYVAQAIYRALQKGAPAYERLLAEREQAAPAPAPAPPGSRPAQKPWWEK